MPTVDTMLPLSLKWLLIHALKLYFFPSDRNLYSFCKLMYHIQDILFWSVFGYIVILYCVVGILVLYSHALHLMLCFLVSAGST
jgi:hypothetical protein